MVLKSTLLFLTLAIIPTGKSELAQTEIEDGEKCTQMRSVLVNVRKTHGDLSSVKNDTVWSELCKHYKRFADCIEGVWTVNETDFKDALEKDYKEKCKSYLASNTAVFGLTFVSLVTPLLFFVIALFYRY
ncbi:hypothetical protein DdX_16509 [Ditylenchus destructor]|uniref:Uncharacterized protein n=1 Tax=Ditylenchus destructor TaxID=166010 RepID=A0AAD4MQ80_9BILA|nr:hypothetical protein DdX_16509 [Ditylenchus destructor]